MAYCDLCSRAFSSETALGQHLRDALRHEFDCHQCRRHFETESARNQHLRDSPKHNICDKCGPDTDFATDDELVEHEVAEHNMCLDCFCYFASPSNLREVGTPLRLPTSSLKDVLI